MKVCAVVRNPSQVTLFGLLLAANQRPFVWPQPEGPKASGRFRELSGSECNRRAHLQMCCRPSAGICTRYAISSPCKQQNKFKYYNQRHKQVKEIARFFLSLCQKAKD